MQSQGLALQQFLPTVMLHEIPAETIESQIDRVLDHLHDEARQMVYETCGVEVTRARVRRAPASASPTWCEMP